MSVLVEAPRETWTTSLVLLIHQKISLTIFGVRKRLKCTVKTVHSYQSFRVSRVSKETESTRFIEDIKTFFILLEINVKITQTTVNTYRVS